MHKSIEIMTFPITIIKLNERKEVCGVCNADATGLSLAVPIWEDILLPNTWTGDWGGAPACRRCFVAQEQLRAPMALVHFRQKLCKEYRRKS